MATYSCWCSAINCLNSRKKTPQKSFFRFPTDEARSKRWVLNSRRADLLNKDVTYLSRNCRLCADHFDQSQFMCAKRKKLIWCAVPTVFNFRGQLTSSRKKLMHTQMPLRPRKCRKKVIYGRSDRITAKACKSSVDNSRTAELEDPNETESQSDAQESSDDGESSQSKAPLSPEEMKLEEQIRRQRAEIESFPLAEGREPELFDTHSSSNDEESLQMKEPLTPNEIKLMQQIRRQKAQLVQLKRHIKILTSEESVSQRSQIRSQILRRRVEKRGDVESVIESSRKYLSGYALEFFACQLRFSNQRATKRTFNDPMKAIALSLYHKSPKAYKMCARLFVLPDVTSLEKWLIELRTKPGFSSTVFDSCE